MIQLPDWVFSALNISQKASLFLEVFMTVVRYTFDYVQGKKMYKKIFHRRLAVSSHSRETADKSGGLAWGSTPMECSPHASDREGGKSSVA